MVSIVPASMHSMAALAELFNRGYTGYSVPITLTADSFSLFARACDLDLDASRVLATEAGPAAFAMLAIRNDHRATGGHHAARGWIGGMGVAPEARGQGLGQMAMDAVLGVARDRGLDHVDLEVLDDNVHASRIYERLGFRDVRRFETWFLAAKPHSADEPASAGVRTESTIDRPAIETDRREATSVTRIPVESCLAIPRLPSDEPAWQRDVRGNPSARGALDAIGVPGPSGPEVWMVFRGAAAGIQIVDIGLAPGVPEAMMDGVVGRLMSEHPGAGVMLLNLPVGDPAGRSLERHGFARRWPQREMRWTP